MKWYSLDKIYLCLTLDTQTKCEHLRWDLMLHDATDIMTAFSPGPEQWASVPLYWCSCAHPEVLRIYVNALVTHPDVFRNVHKHFSLRWCMFHTCAYWKSRYNCQMFRFKKNKKKTIGDKNATAERQSNLSVGHSPCTQYHIVMLLY